PRDVAVVIDTTATQAGRPLLNARLILEELAKAARADDRLDVFTVNTPDTTRSLTHGFQTAKGDKVKEAIDYLTNKEYAAGAAEVDPEIDRGVRRPDLLPDQVHILGRSRRSAAGPAAAAPRRRPDAGGGRAQGRCEGDHRHGRGPARRAEAHVHRLRSRPCR